MSLINSLNNLMADAEYPGSIELHEYLADHLTDADGCGKLVNVEKLLRSRTFRVVVDVSGIQRSVVIKQMSLQQSFLERQVIQRWLPIVDLDGNGPPLAGSVAERNLNCVWHIYDDLGNRTLDKQVSDDKSVRMATHFLGQMHARSALHPILAECRVSGGAFGSDYYTICVRDALRCLQAISTIPTELVTASSDMIASLQENLESLWQQRFMREQTVRNYGGPEVLTHGDLWLTNIFVLPGEDKPDLSANTLPGHEIRLIDWDHVGVGPVIYDLSTYLYRVPDTARHQVLDWYLDAAEPMGWRLPDTATFNLLCETAEYSRLASAIIWPALGLYEDNNASWAINELAEINKWFSALQPVFPELSDRAESALSYPG